MDDEAKFGPVLHRLSFAQAIEQDLLSDYQVVVVGVSERSYGEMAERAAFVTTDGETVTDARTLARQIGLLRAMRNHDLHRIVSFHSRISGASRFATSLLAVAEWMPGELRPAGELWAGHVSGKMTSGERETRLNRLRAVTDGERGLVTNARCLSEGVDVPTLDGVAFIDPRRSQVDVVQAVGRAIRKADEKTIGTIVIPVFVDEDADPADALDSSEFERVWQVVRALRDHDDALAEELDQCRRQLGRLGTLGKRPAKLILDLPTSVGVAFAHAFDGRLVEATTRSWEFWFGLLERFAAREKHTRVPAKHAETGHPLGQWVANQRSAYREGWLSDERTAYLQALPAWTWHARDTAWEEGFARLERFAVREGHARVPVNHQEDGYPLGQWDRQQRFSKQTGRLPADRLARLEGLPGWTLNRVDSAWESGFSLLERFNSREHHARVPKGHTEDGFPLGSWVAGQRERFAVREGHARVPVNCTEDGYWLGSWANQQRDKYRAGQLVPHRAARLEALPRWTWDLLDAAWNESYSHLERFVAREGHARVPPRQLKDGYPLGQWVKQQRSTYRSRRLSDVRVAKLEALPGWIWNVRERSS